MRRRTLWMCAAVLALPADQLHAQAPARATTGPVIEGFGPVYDVESPDFATPLGETLRVVFDVSQGAEQPTSLNGRIETVARFLNMHGRAGVDADRMHVALVLHGSAGKDALAHQGYRRRYGVDNPNLGLLRELKKAGVRIVLCGQTAAHRGLLREELAPEVDLALSAMTALVTLQAEGYSLIGF